MPSAVYTPPDGVRLMLRLVNVASVVNAVSPAVRSRYERVIRPPACEKSITPLNSYQSRRITEAVPWDSVPSPARKYGLPASKPNSMNAVFTPANLRPMVEPGIKSGVTARFKSSTLTYARCSTAVSAFVNESGEMLRWLRTSPAPITLLLTSTDAGLLTTLVESRPPTLKRTTASGLSVLAMVQPSWPLRVVPAKLSDPVTGASKS